MDTIATIGSEKEINVRQELLLPANKLATTQALVIGVGGIGRQVAETLVKIGVPNLVLIDDDRVEVRNLRPQGFWDSDVALSKVRATADTLESIRPGIKVECVEARFNRASHRELQLTTDCYVFSCVDSILTRGMIWRQFDGGHDAYYPTTLFAQEEAFAGRCTSEATYYAASVAAGLMVAQMAKHLRGDKIPIAADISADLNAMTFSAVGEVSKAHGLLIDGRMSGEILRIITAAI